MGDDDGYNIPKPSVPDGDTIITKIADFVTDNPRLVTAGILAIIAMAFYKKNKVLSVFLIALTIGVVATKFVTNND
jgi:hypothetical protein